jgi:hypothetical protein
MQFLTESRDEKNFAQQNCIVGDHHYGSQLAAKLSRSGSDFDAKLPQEPYPWIEVELDSTRRPSKLDVYFNSNRQFLMRLESAPK